MLVLICDQWYQFFLTKQMRRETALFPKRISICQNCKVKYNLLFVFFPSKTKMSVARDHIPAAVMEPVLILMEHTLVTVGLG